MRRPLRHYLGAVLLAGALAWTAGCSFVTQPVAALPFSEHGPRLFWSSALASQGNLISSAKLDGSDFRQAAIRLRRGRHAVVLAAANGRIYWAGYSDGTSDSWIGSARVDGTDVRQRQLVVDDYINALAVSGRFIYIATPERLERARLGSEHPLRTLQILARGVQINSVAVGNNSVYWGDDGPLNRSGGWHGVIHRANLDGGHRARLRIAGLHQPACLTVAGPYLLWGDYEAGRIGRVRVDGSEAAVILEPAGGPVGLAAYAGTLYWAMRSEGDTAEGDAIGSATLDGEYLPVGVNQAFCRSARAGRRHTRWRLAEGFRQAV